MKKTILFSALTLLAGALLAADSSPKDDVTNAAKKLGEKANYSWKQTVVVPESAQFKPGPTEGQIEKDGFAHLSWSFNDNTSQGFVKGDKGAATDPDGAWQSLTELEGSEGFGRFTARRLRNFKAPAAQVIELAGFAKELKKDGEAIVGELTEEGAKAQIRFGPNSNATNAKASVKFWLKDGELAKYEIKAAGKLDFNGNEVDADRTSTIEIKDVGTTKVEVPAEARKKLDPAPATAPAAK
jgi:hypothetical protein